MFTRLFTTLLFLLSLLVTNTDAAAREWTAKSGHKITGDFISLEKGIVKISQPNGFTAEIPHDQLSEECRNFVDTQTAKVEKNSPFVIRQNAETPTKLDYFTPLEILQREAEKDNPEALYYLAMCYLIGLNDSPADEIEIKASELFQRGSKFADSGNPFAQCCHGNCFQNAFGVEADLEEAAKWYRKAAEQGNVIGELEYGLCLLEGTGVNQNEKEGIRFLQKAADKGDFKAQIVVSKALAYGEFVPQDLIQAEKYANRAFNTIRQNVKSAGNAIELVELEFRFNVFFDDALLRSARIDLSKCPQEFKLAFIDFIHALQDRRKLWQEVEAWVEQTTGQERQILNEIERYNSTENVVGGMVESFLRGMMGDPLGKTQELMAEEKKLRARAENFDARVETERNNLIDKEAKINERLETSLRQCERIAIMHDAVFTIRELLDNASQEE